LNIPFISSAIRDAKIAREALKAKQYHTALLRVTGAVAYIVLPAYIGKAVHDSFKEGKMTGEYEHKFRGFNKEASAIGNIIGLPFRAAGSAIKGVGGAMVAHPLATAGVVGGAGAMYGGKKLWDAAKARQYGPTTSYGGQFQ
jgi:hypothetical protein